MKKKQRRKHKKRKREKRCYCVEDGLVSPYRAGNESEIIRRVFVFPLRSTDLLDMNLKGVYETPIFKCSICNEEYITRIYPNPGLEPQ